MGTDSEQVRGLELALANLRLANEYGLDDLFWERFRKDESFRRRMAAHATCGGFDSSMGVYKYGGFKGLHVFGDPEWVEFTYTASTKQSRDENEAFPWSYVELRKQCPFYPENSLFDTHFAFLCKDVATRPSLPTIDIQLRNLDRFAQQYVNWAGHPDVVFQDDLPSFKHSTIVSYTQWCLLAPPVRCRFEEIPVEYTLASACEYVLGLILFFQKYGSFEFFHHNDMLRNKPLLTADKNTWDVLGTHHTGVQISKDSQKGRVDVIFADISDRTLANVDQPRWWALKRKPGV